MAQADGSFRLQIDDIHSVKLLGTSWLVHVAYAANKLTALHLNGWLAFTSWPHSWTQLSKTGSPARPSDTTLIQQTILSWFKEVFQQGSAISATNSIATFVQRSKSITYKVSF